MTKLAYITLVVAVYTKHQFWIQFRNLFDNIVCTVTDHNSRLMHMTSSGTITCTEKKVVNQLWLIPIHLKTNTHYDHSKFYTTFV